MTPEETLVQRLRDWVASFPHSAPLAVACREAADVIERQSARISRMERLLQRIAYGATGNTIKATTNESVADRIVADVCNERMDLERRISRMEKALVAADHLYTRLDHRGGAPGCPQCDAADAYLAARSETK